MFNLESNTRFQTLRYLRWFSLLLLSTLVACANLGGTAAPENVVRQRATERWQALVAGDMNQAYGYNAPSFRAVVSSDGFRKRFGNAGTWVGAEVVAVNCPDAAKCMATVRIDFKPAFSRRSGDKISTHADETWVLEDGQWWLFQRI